MSTATVAVIAPPTIAAIPIKTESALFAVVFKVDAEGNPKRDEKGNVLAPRHTSSENDIKYLEDPEYVKKQTEKAKGKEPELEVIALKQMVSRPIAGTLEGFETLVTDPEERLNIINKGLSSKFNQKIRTALIEQNDDGTLVFQPTDGMYDATPLVQESTRATMSQTDKAFKLLAGLDEATRAAIIAQFAKVAAAGAAPQLSDSSGD